MGSIIIAVPMLNLDYGRVWEVSAPSQPFYLRERAGIHSKKAGWYYAANVYKCWYVYISVGQYFILRDKISEYLLLLLKHYNILWNLASNKIFLHSCRSLATVYQILIHIAFKSSSTSSIQLFHSFLFCFFLPFW